MRGIEGWLPAENVVVDQQLHGTDRVRPGLWERHRLRMSRRQRFGRWLGNVLINLGARIGGDAW